MSDNRVALIDSIKTPAALVALVFLVLEALLVGLAAKADGLDFTILVVGIVVAFLLMIVVSGWLLMKGPPLFPPQPVDRLAPIEDGEISFDVFLSAPMAATESDAEYEESRSRALTIKSSLEEWAKFEKVYFAGEKIEKRDDFDVPRFAVVDDFDKIRRSRHFVLLYPNRAASSVLVETGFALALGKEAVVFVQRKTDLPFLLRNAGEALNTVNIYEYRDDKHLARLIQKNGQKLFALPG